MLRRDSESIDEAGVSLRGVSSPEVSLLGLGPRSWLAPRSKPSMSVLQKWYPTCFGGDLDSSPTLARRDDSP